MKIAVIAVLTLVATAAHAAPLKCHTNDENDPRYGNISLTISSLSEIRAIVTEVTEGGAPFIKAPRKFDVAVDHISPDVVRYLNDEEGFDLTITLKPIGGKIRGTLSSEVNGRTYTGPVVCE